MSDVMRPIEAILDAEDHVMKAIQEMVFLDVNLIPVLQEGQLVGVVRSVDVFHYLAQLLD
jgi:predicted transcriptional regulator